MNEGGAAGGASIEAAMSGRPALSLQRGIPAYTAMAGLVFETCQVKKIPVLSLQGPQDDSRSGPGADSGSPVPGIPALCAGAALLGAPLTHDFAVVSLTRPAHPLGR